MKKDINGVIIEIGDIVKIENSPIKSDNATYVSPCFNVIFEKNAQIFSFWLAG